MTTSNKYVWGYSDPRAALSKGTKPKTWQERLDMALSPYSMHGEDPGLLREVRHVVQGMHRQYEEQMTRLSGQVWELNTKVTDLSGFMHWVMHAYPETITQYNALMELQRASNGGSESVSESGPMASP